MLSVAVGGMYGMYGWFGLVGTVPFDFLTAVGYLRLWRSFLRRFSSVRYVRLRSL